MRRWCMTLVGNSTMMGRMPTPYFALPGLVTWALTWYTSTCIKLVALPTAEAVQVLARLASKNTLYLSCLVHCQRRETTAITGLIKDHSQLVKFVPTVATLACLCGHIPTYA